MKTIYIVDDDLSILDSLTLWFTRENYLVETFPDSTSFLRSLLLKKPSLIIMDVNLIIDDGRQLCLLVKAKYSAHLPIILISGNPGLGNGFQNYEADAFLAKPFSLHTLTEIVSSYLN